MRYVRMLVVLVLALACFQGDGRSRPTVIPSSSAVPVPDPRLQFWFRFWFDDNGRVRMQMSGPASPRVQAAFADAASRARLRGFKLKLPQIRQTRPEIELFMPNEVRHILAVTYQGVGVILVNHWWVDRLSDDDLRILAGHELGHVIDRQNQRYGHPFLDAMPQDGGGEVVANLIAAYLYSPEEVAMFDVRIMLTPR